MERQIILSKLYNAYSKKEFLPGIKHNSKFQLLYNGIINNKITNDNQAFQKLYQSRNTNAFRALKNRFLVRIIKEISNMNLADKMPSQNSKIHQEILQNQKLLSLLNNSLDAKESIIILKSILNSSIAIGDSNLILNTALKLYEITSIGNQNKKELIHYWDLVTKNKQFLLDKIKIIKVYSYFISCISNSRNLTHLKIDKEIEKLLFEVHESESPDYFTKHKIYSSIYYYHFIKSDIPKLLEICNRALQYFKTKMNLNKFGYYSFVIKYSYVLMYLKKNKNVKEYFETLLSVPISRKLSLWYNINMYAIKNLIYLSEYKEAMIKLIDVTRHSSYEKIKTPYFTEIFKIKEAYLNVLLKMKKFELESEGILKKKPFRINKFLNEVPNYSKDKRGSNISILIIHVFYLLINKNYDLILNRLESLKAYSHRYLRNDDSLRSNAFIKILLQLPSSNYNPIALKRNAGKYYHKMINAPVHIAARHIEVEVIPYEKQYELLTDLLNMRLNKQI